MNDNSPNDSELERHYAHMSWVSRRNKAFGATLTFLVVHVAVIFSVSVFGGRWVFTSGAFEVLMISQLVAVFTVFSLVLYAFVHLLTTRYIDENSRVLWLLGAVCLPGLALPAYFLLVMLDEGRRVLAAIDEATLEADLA